MAKVRKKLGKKFDIIFPFENINYLIVGIGVLVIIIGYIILYVVQTVEGFFPLVLAPILLVLGYCVIIPFGILYRRKPKMRKDQQKAIEDSSLNPSGKTS